MKLRFINSKTEHAASMSPEAMRRLLARFFDGTTSPDEEAAIAEAYRRHPEAMADDIERLRPMFAWYGTLRRAPRQRRRRRYAIPAAAAAVAVLAIAGATLLMRPALADDSLRECYRGSYIMRNGERITDFDAIYPELCSAERYADSLVRASSDLHPTTDEIERAMVENAISSINDPQLAEILRRDLMSN